MTICIKYPIGSNALWEGNSIISGLRLKTILSAYHHEGKLAANLLEVTGNMEMLPKTRHIYIEYIGISVLIHH